MYSIVLFDKSIQAYEIMIHTLTFVGEKCQKLKTIFQYIRIPSLLIIIFFTEKGVATLKDIIYRILYFLMKICCKLLYLLAIHLKTIKTFLNLEIYTWIKNLRLTFYSLAY